MTSLARDVVLDLWANLSHKRAMGGIRTPGAAPSWIGPDHHRRLEAYKLLTGYLSNVARAWLPESTPDEDVRDHREYGDALNLVNAVVSAVLGEEQTPTVHLADANIPQRPLLPERPDPPPANPNDVEARIAALALERWEADALAAIDAWETDWRAQPEARRQQEWLRQWATDERLPLKLLENERNAVGLGDGVLTLGWSPAKQRPILAVYDPGFYFPVLEDQATEYPSTIHLAWEYEDGATTWVRRLTWRLVEPPAGAAVRFPWTPTGAPNADRVCVYSDAVWKLEDLAKAGRIEDLDNTRGARYLTGEDGAELNDRPLGLDFIPVIHTPNTSTGHHYGMSLLAGIAQVLDDLAATDTDTQAAASVAGTPPIVLSGKSVPAKVTSYGPRSVFNVGENGSMAALDTRGALTELRNLTQDLLQRASSNTRVPAEVLGRVKVSEVPSGIALALGFGPLRGLVRELRLTRGEKDALLLKFAARMAQAGGQLPAGDLHPAELERGEYLPNDLASLVEELANAVNAKILSRRTAVTMQAAAGVPIDDVEEELAAIDRDDVEGADLFLTATGDDVATRKRLGLTGPSPRPPAPNRDPAGTTGALPPGPVLPGAAGGAQ